MGGLKLLLAQETHLIVAFLEYPEIVPDKNKALMKIASAKHKRPLATLKELAAQLKKQPEQATIKQAF